MQLHGGSFSVPVNLHALGEYFRELGGQVLHSSRRDHHFKVAALLAGLGDLALDDVRLAFAEAPPHQRALALASIALTINAAEEAIEFAQESLRLFAQNDKVLAIKGLAHAALGQRDQALHCADVALALQPDNAPARQLKEKLTVVRRQ